MSMFMSMSMSMSMSISEIKIFQFIMTVINRNLTIFK